MNLRSAYPSFVTVIALLFCQDALANLDQKATAITFDDETIARLMARAAANQPLFQKDDIAGVLVKTTPGPGSNTGMGGYLSFYLPPGTQVVEAEYLQPGSGGTLAPSPIKGPAVAPLGNGPIAAKTTTALNGLNCGPNLLGITSAAVTTIGVHRGTLAGLYADTGIFYATDARTAWQSFTASGGFDGNVATSDNLLTNYRGEASVPVTKWDPMQLIGFGLSAPASPVIDPDGRGNLPWGLGSVVAGPESGYGYAFNRDYWQANPTDPNRMKNSITPGPWRRIGYAGSQAGKDSPGLSSSALGFVGVNVAGQGYDFQINSSKSTQDLLRYGNPLPATLNLTDATSPKALRFSVGSLELSRPEYARVRLRILANRGQPGSPFDAAGGLVLNSDAFSSDSGGENGGRHHAWRSYKPSTVSVNFAAMLQMTGSKPFVAVGETFTYRLTAIAAGTNALNAVTVTGVLPAGLSFLSSTPPPTSLAPLTWTFPALDPNKPVANPPVRTITMNVKATGGGTYTSSATLAATGGITASASESTLAGMAPLLITDLAATPSFVVPGATVSYTLIIHNYGSGPSASPLVLKDQLPTGFSFTGLTSSLINGATLPTGAVKITAPTPDKPIFTVSGAIAAGKSLRLTFNALVTNLADAGTCGNAFSVLQNGREISSPSLGLVTVGGGRLGNTVYRDWNGNGIQDTGEEGVTGVSVQLLFAGANGTFGNGDDVLTTAVTDSNGKFLFTGLAAGNYRTTVPTANFNTGQPLTSYLPTGDADGTATPNQATTSLTTNEVKLTQNFGYRFNSLSPNAASIGDTIFSYENNNGIENIGEPGIPNITVDLYEDTNGNGVINADDVKIATVSSADGIIGDLNGDGEIDPEGYYLFKGLDPMRKYIVDVDSEDPEFMTAFGRGPHPSTPDKVAVGAFTAGFFDAADFGFFGGPPASIGDQIYIDTNRNNVYDPGDLPIAGLTLKLYLDSNGDGIANESVAATLVSDASGRYQFTNLGSANYIVKIEPTDPAIPVATIPLVTQQLATVQTGDDYADADFHFVRLLEKAVDKSFATAGQMLRYTLSPYYPGSSSLSNLIVTDIIPSGATYAGGASPVPTAQPSIGGTGTVQWNLGSTVAAVSGAIISPGYAPTAATQTTTAQVVDSTIEEGRLTTNNGTNNEIKTRPETGSRKAALISFSLPTLTATDLIDRAVVRLTVSSARSANHTVSLRALNTAWTEGTVSWGDTDGVGAGDWTTTGVFGTNDYGSLSYGSYNAPFKKGQTLEFDVTNLVRGWRDGTIPNLGVALVATGTDNGDLGFYSSEGQSAGVKPGPQLVVEYSSSGNVTNATLLDAFASASYALNAGTRNWTGGWIETGDDGDPGGGKIKISGGTMTIADTLNCSVSRQANLSGATAAAIEFNLTANSLDNFADQIVAQASNNAGLSWVTLLNMTLGTPLGLKSFDLISALGSVGPNTLVRFARIGGGGAGKNILLDNVKITFSTPAGATTATTMAADTALATGTRDIAVTMTVTSSVSVTVTPPPALTLTATGGATAVKLSGPTPSSASASPTGTTFTYHYAVSAGTSIGSVRFSGTPTGPAGFSFAVASSQSVLTTAPLTFASTVNTPAPLPPVSNIASLSGTGLLISSPLAVTATTASIGDTVWADLNGNGIRDAVEPGLSGVSLRVYADANQDGLPDGPPVGTAVTDVAGKYRLYGLSAGHYLAGYDFTTVLPLSLPTTPVYIPVYNLAAYQQFSGANFGVHPPLPAGSPQACTVGDSLWIDADLNGLSDSWELPLQSIPVKIYADVNNNGLVDLADALLASSTTNTTGQYAFAGLQAARYLVDVVETAPAFPAELLLGSGGANLTTGLLAINPTSGTVADMADFGYAYDGSITGVIFRDDNSNTLRGPGESAAANVEIFLYPDTNANGIIDLDEVPIAETMADAAGLYTFAKLPPGAYIVNVDESTVTTATGTTGSMVPTAGSQRIISLSALEHRTGVDVGFVEGSVVAGLIIHDADGNGQWDVGETGLGNITVTLTGTPLTGGTLTLTQPDTDTNGAWQFLVPAGTYTVSYAMNDPEIPAGLTVSTTPDSYLVATTPGGQWLGLDFGRDHAGTIGTTIFADVNSSGFRNVGESGVSGITVNLYSTTPTAVLIATQLTDGNGRCSFTGLPDATYEERVDQAGLPASFISTPTADPDPLKDGKGIVVLSGGVTVPDLLFGYAPAVFVHSITGVVFEDANGNGSATLPAEGRSGITVTAAIDADQNGTPEQTLTTVTTSDGAWTFLGIPANASVTIRVLTGTLPTTAYVQTIDPDATLNHQTTIASLSTDLTGVNFGYVQQFASLSGTVVTGNGDGIAGGGESGHSGVSITLNSAGPDNVLGTSDDTTTTQTTIVAGAYGFTNLLPGSYEIVKSNPAFYRSLADADGGNPDIISLTLVPGQNRTGMDFELALTPRTGHLFTDSNGDGQQNAGEPNLANTSFTVTEVNGTPHTVITDATGNWTLTVPPGSLTLSLTLQPGLIYSLPLSTLISNVGAPPVLGFYGGTFTGTIPTGGSLLVLIQPPADAVRMRLIGTHSADVAVRLQASDDPGTSGSTLWGSSGVVNSLLTTPLSTTVAPWQPGVTYYIRLVNNGTTPQPVTLTSDGRTVATDDEDADGMADAWEVLHYGDTTGAPNSDTDFDGIDTLMEFLYGTSPTVPNGSALPNSLTATNTATTINLTFSRPAILPPGLRLRLLESSDLEHLSWQPLTILTGNTGWVGSVTVNETAPANGRVEDSITINLSGADAQRMFFKLELTTVPAP